MPIYPEREILLTTEQKVAVLDQFAEDSTLRKLSRMEGKSPHSIMRQESNSHQLWILSHNSENGDHKDARRLLSCRYKAAKNLRDPNLHAVVMVEQGNSEKSVIATELLAPQLLISRTERFAHTNGIKYYTFMHYIEGCSLADLVRYKPKLQKDMLLAIAVGMVNETLRIARKGYCFSSCSNAQFRFSFKDKNQKALTVEDMRQEKRIKEVQLQDVHFVGFKNCVKSNDGRRVEALHALGNVLYQLNYIGDGGSKLRELILLCRNPGTNTIEDIAQKFNPQPESQKSRWNPF